MSNHTYLFQEATWKANGVFIGADGIEIPVEGEARIVHGQRFWENDGFMRVLAQPPFEFRSRYQVKPFEKEADTTQWFSENPGLGTMLGNFIVVGDSILSLFGTKDHLYTGTECMRRIDDHLYRCCGVLMKAHVKISSWSVDLKK